MVNYDSDEALLEIHDEMYRSEEEKPQGIKKLSPNSRLFIGLFIGVIVLLFMFKKITFNQGIMFLIAGAIILYFMNQNDTLKRELSWVECMVRINDLLKFLQKHPIGDVPQIPPGEISVKPIGRKQWFEGQSFKRSFAVDIYDKDTGLSEHYFIEIDIFTGDIITFRCAPEGVYGDETKDIKLMPQYYDFMSRKRDEFMGRLPKRKR